LSDTYLRTFLFATDTAQFVAQYHVMLISISKHYACIWTFDTKKCIGTI